MTPEKVGLILLIVLSEMIIAGLVYDIMTMNVWRKKVEKEIDSLTELVKLYGDIVQNIMNREKE